MKNIYFCSIAFLCAGFSWSELSHAGDCDSVLKSGTMATSAYQRDYSYSQLVDIRFASIGYSESKKDKSLTGDIPIGDVVLGVGYTENSYKSRRDAIQKSQLWKTQFASASSYYAASGDENILNAWRACVGDAAGLKIDFLSIAPLTVNASIRYINKMGGALPVRLRNDFRLPSGVTIVSGENCFGRRASDKFIDRFHEGDLIYPNSDGCKVTFGFASAHIPFPIVLNTTQGEFSAQAYLPPRMRLVKTEKPYIFDNPKRSALTCKGGVPLKVGVPASQRRITKTLTQSYCSDIANDYYFDPSTFQGSSRIYQNFRDPRVQFHSIESNYSGSSELLVTLRCISGGGHWQKCDGMPAIKQYKLTWEPISDYVQTR